MPARHVNLPNFNDAKRIRDSLEMVYERKLEEGETELYKSRKIMTLAYHYNCKTVSAGANQESSLGTAVFVRTITDPEVVIGTEVIAGGATTQVVTVTYTGKWYTDRVSIVDNQDGTSRVDVVLVNEGAWAFEELDGTQEEIITNEITLATA